MFKGGDEMSLIKGMWVCVACCSVGLMCCLASFDWQDKPEQISSEYEPAAR